MKHVLDTRFRIVLLPITRKIGLTIPKKPIQFSVRESIHTEFRTTFEYLKFR